MKRIVSLIMVFAVVLGLFAGCGTQSTSGGKQTTVTFWTHINADWNASHDRLIAEFEAKNPGIKVVRESFPYDEFESKTQTSLINKEGGADIYEIWGGWALDFANAGVFAPVPDKMVGNLTKDSYEPVLGAFKHEDKYYGVPLEFNIEYGGILVSKPKFEQLGLSYPKTWDDMIKIGREHSKSDASGVVFEQRGFDFVAWDSLTYTWLSMILSSGESYMKDEKFNFNTPIGTETMQKLVDYTIKDKMTNLDGLTNSDFEPYQKFFTGEALIVPRGPWVIPEGKSTYELEYGKDFEYVEMPFYGSKKLFAAETGWGLAVNESSTKKDAAWKFIEFWTKPENMLKHNIACAMVPASKTVAHDPAFVKELPFMAPILNILDGGRFIGYFNTDTLKEAVSNTYTDIVNNGTPVPDALKKLDETLNTK